MSRKGRRFDGLTSWQMRERAKQQRAHQRESSDVAQMVFERAEAVRGTTQIPLVVYAPLLTSCEATARSLLVQFPELVAGRAPEDALSDVTGYLCDCFLSIALFQFDPAHYARWQEERPFNAMKGETGDERAAPPGGGERSSDEAGTAGPAHRAQGAQGHAEGGVGASGGGGDDGGKAPVVGAEDGAQDGPDAPRAAADESDAAGGHAD